MLKTYGVSFSETATTSLYRQSVRAEGAPSPPTEGTSALCLHVCAIPECEAKRPRCRRGGDGVSQPVFTDGFSEVSVQSGPKPEAKSTDQGIKEAFMREGSIESSGIHAAFPHVSGRGCQWVPDQTLRKPPRVLRRIAHLTSSRRQAVNQHF